MRRLVALLVIALLGATAYGLSNASSGISVNGTTVSNSTMRAELTAISSNATLGCYLAALDPVTYGAGAGDSVRAADAATWANLRIEGVAIVQYAKTSLKYHPTAAALASAKTSLESELAGAAAERAASDPADRCSATPTEALKEMPAEMRTFEIAAQAASLDLVRKLNTTVPLTLSSMNKYYASHTASYETICISVAVVTPTQLSAFSSAQKEGATIAELAKEFSEDPSSTKGGAFGCFGPTSSSFSGVRSDTTSTPLNTFPTTPEYITYNNQTAALFVAPTKRTVTPFAQAESAVASDLADNNASAADSEKEKILYYSAISVDPAFGRWGLNTTGPEVFAPATPAAVNVGSASTVSALSTASSVDYK